MGNRKWEKGEWGMGDWGLKIREWEWVIGDRAKEKGAIALLGSLLPSGCVLLPTFRRLRFGAALFLPIPEYQAESVLLCSHLDLRQRQSRLFRVSSVRVRG